MIIGVVGAGAVGGYFGALLKKAGHEVIFVARGEHFEAMKKEGLSIHSDSPFHITEKFTSDIKDIRDAELLLFAVKSTETIQVAQSISPFLRADAFILTLQNGLDNEEILAGLFGRERILSGAAYITSKIKSPGVIEQKGPTSLVIGGLEGVEEARINNVIALFQNAEIDCRKSDDILQKKWDKLLWNVTFNPLSAVAMVTIGEILDNKGLRTTAEQVLREALEVGSKMGVEIRQKVVERIFPAAELARNHKTSMLQDRERGKKMETESLCGYLVHQARLLQVDTPVLNTLYHILSSFDKKEHRIQ
jgi:2-dehydropantoate 2-reductase